jgi:predicted DNA-binding transcriptional regulator AlpA
MPGGQRPTLVDTVGKLGETVGVRPTDLLDIQAVADLLGVQRETVEQTRWRGKMPDPDLYVGRSPAWRRRTIDQWIKETGRLTADER